MKPINQEVLMQVENLLNVGIALSAEKDPNRLLEMIVSEARGICNADAGTLFLCEGQHLHFQIIQNESLNIFKGGTANEEVDLPPVPLMIENVSACCALSREVINIADVYEADGFDFSGPRKYDSITGYKTTSMLVVPMEDHKNEVIGVLQLINAQNEEGIIVPFAKHLEKVVKSLASQAAVALSNMQLLKEIEKLFHSFVQVMATAIDARTPYNTNHARRVAALTSEMCQEINKMQEGKWKDEYFDKDRSDQLIMAAWLHDIGKIATPLTVMNKASRLENRLTLIMQRFDYISSSIELENLKSKTLNPNVENKESSLEDSNKLLEDKMKKLEEARTLINQANHGNTIVSPEMQEQLISIAQERYINRAGDILPWLEEEELSCLCVSKGTLTTEERCIMESHVDVTIDTLAKMPFTGKFEKVPYFASLHHEHLDGMGYPFGLREKDIPVEGRILALLDVFDALIASDRPYKKALSLEESLKILGFMVKDGKLDADLYEIFCQNKIWERVKL